MKRRHWKFAICIGDSLAVAPCHNVDRSISPCCRPFELVLPQVPWWERVFIARPPPCDSLLASADQLAKACPGESQSFAAQAHHYAKVIIFMWRRSLSIDV
jgi:hypothetical protein